MNRKRSLKLLMVGVVLLLCITPGRAQDQQGRAKAAGKSAGFGSGFGFNTDSRSPIDITSDTVEGNQKSNTVVFKGNVIAKQENTTLYTNTLTITYDPENKKLKEIVGFGNVKIVHQNSRATSQKVIFYQDENKVVLEGDAVIRDGENVIRGERVTYYIDEERSVVEGGKSNRVNTTIVPPKKEETKK